MKKVNFRYRPSMKYSKYRQTFDWFVAVYARQIKENFGDNSSGQAKVRKPNKKLKETNFWTSEISKKIMPNEMECLPTFPLQDKRPVNMSSDGGKTETNNYRFNWNCSDTGSTDSIQFFIPCKF